MAARNHKGKGAHKGNGRGEGHDGEFDFKFPRTQHLLNAGGGAVTRDDLVMDSRDTERWFKGRTLVVEEKVDGANLGIDQDPVTKKLRFRNRSHWVTSATSTQFRRLDEWLNDHPGIWKLFSTPSSSSSSTSSTSSASASPYILFGEWLYARHSIRYTRLPDLFLAFDIYDKSQRVFLSTTARNLLLQGTGIKTVRRIASGHFSKEDLLGFLETPSHFYDGPVEGVYLRLEDEAITEPERAKIVRPDFLQSDNFDTHWSKNELIKNVVDPSLAFLEDEEMPEEE